MVRNTGKQHANGKRKASETNVKRDKLDDELDALFSLPVAEFTAARNALATQLKQSGRRDESDRVKALAKPSVTAWAVNQLYSQHREAFDQLLATGQRFRAAQTSSRAGKVADIRAALDARRGALSHLSDLASSLLQSGGHNPTPETIHRVSTTLEALSAYASFSADARPGRLTRDVDPPGFDSFASLIPSAGMTKMTEEPARATASQKSGSASSTPRKSESAKNTSQLEQTRQTKIAGAKVSLQEAKKLLSEARARAQKLEVAQKKASADAKAAEKNRREAEARFAKARVASEDADRRAESAAAEAAGAAKAAEDAGRDVAQAAEELEKLFGES